MTWIRNPRKKSPSKWYCSHCARQHIGGRKHYRNGIVICDLGAMAEAAGLADEIVKRGL